MFEEDDRPSDEALDTAIDYAIDQIETPAGADAPDSIIPSGSGRIAMEWNVGGVTISIEFISRGTARYSMFQGGKLVVYETLVRNPESRELEKRRG
jgi:hypothetical protein